MRKAFSTLLLISLFVGVGSLAAKGRSSGSTTRGTGSSSRSTHVRGSVHKDGTYVAPHERSKANKTENDNWSTKGNNNPRTGKEGTKPPAK